ncbi:Glycosyltransferase involved in cell wall bisynthesis [Belnapia rosea]|uniref:Glycosyltransferase involved in cell wall bisynthesis n=2 Tax=Belnapia rosea TaxID=938405 RepID=A0A1G6QN19_9PROT|nr:Glycosyltransferase involved in cell wall bisynthesis [Belnapia rosea]
MPDMWTATTPSAPWTASAIEIAVVIPAYRQPGLLPEAILSVLGQQSVPPVAVIVVDDGCPFPETAQVALDLAALHPGQVFLLRRPNGGLSAARNTGIDFALRAFPACRALHFLDADNRLHPHYLARALAALDAAPDGIGWVYPDIDEFGGREHWTTGGAFSLLQLLTCNYCEAGSVVRRKMVETGLRFDETMRDGFEDWDFWLSAAGRGWRGQHLPQAGFRYRRRPESMLSASERLRPLLLGLLHRKHAALLAPRHLLAEAAREAPRFALHMPDEGTIRLVADPAAPEGQCLSPNLARERLAAAMEQPSAVHHPDILCFTESAVLDLLTKSGVLHMVFWWGERLLREAQFVALEIVPTTEPMLALERPGPADGHVTAAPLILARSQVLWEAAGDPSPAWIESLQAPKPQPITALLRLRLPVPSSAASPIPLRLLLLEAAALGRLRRQRSGLPANWKREYRPPRSRMVADAEAAIGLGPLLPRLRQPGRRDIGFLLPLFSFAGLEKVILNQAAVLRRRGWRTHLIILGSGRIDRGADFPAAFDSVMLMEGLGEAAVAWESGYFGAGISHFGGSQSARDVLGVLATLDVLINVHSLAGQALMAPLRRLGIRTFGGLHLIEHGPHGEPRGTPHVQASYEHAYDGIMVISRQLRDWCIAAGIPARKLHLVANAPGYATRPARIAVALGARQRHRRRPLQVLFLGRMDWQKGLDRLAAIIDRSKELGLRWRVVGRAVLADANQPELGVPVEPPVFEPQALDELYAWADVLVLPSRFEGVPLVVLEAQRMGCTVIATGVGAVAEVIRHEEDGFLIPHHQPEEAIIAGFLATLARLAEDRTQLAAIGAAAAARLAACGWPERMQEFMDHLDKLVPPDRPSPAASPGMPG